ncbi:hypothetical protein F5B17DRAFT_408871 [Nemania serpens]|nr:hypothetical protein F5B17DRAFT_408871 [Nemania serpens]
MGVFFFSLLTLRLSISRRGRARLRIRPVSLILLRSYNWITDLLRKTNVNHIRLPLASPLGSRKRLSAQNTQNRYLHIRTHARKDTAKKCFWLGLLR